MKYVLCYGDSNTHGYDPGNGLRYPEEIRWTARLSRMMGSQYRIIEEGLNNRTTAIEPAGEPWLSGACCLEACVRTHMPVDLVILMLGSNDMKSRYRQDENMIGEHIRGLIRTIKRASAEKSPEGTSCKILLVSPVLVEKEAASGPFADEFTLDHAVPLSARLAPVYQKIAEEEKVEFMDAARYAKAGTKDGLHLEETGHRDLATAMAGKVWDLFELK